MAGATGSPDKKEFVLFYSQGCKYCNNFYTQLKQKNELLRKFNLVDIDTIEDYPEEVDEIPCVYDGKAVFKGADAFKWLGEKSIEYLDPADNSLNYSFINGAEEQIFNNYSLLDQKNGSFGMGESSAQAGQENKISKSANMSLESLMSSRSSDMKKM
jgi:hypothetical protein